MPLVVKKDGRRESYDRMKIINGLKRACEKRPVSINTIETIADRIERGPPSGDPTPRVALTPPEVAI